MPWLNRADDRERGATSTEYALLAGFVALAFATAASLFGADLSAAFDQLAAFLAAHVPTP